MAVSVDTRIGEYFTWGSYPYETWNGDADKSWETSGYTEILLSDRERVTIDEGTVSQVAFADTEETFASTNNTFLINSIKKKVGKVLIIPLSIADTFSRSTVSQRDFNENINLTERYLPSTQYFRKAFESYGLGETFFNKSFNKVPNEPISVHEHNVKNYSSLTKEVLHASDVYDRTVDYSRLLSENVRAVELYSNNYSHFEWEEYAISDSYYLSSNKIVYRDVNIGEGLKRKATFHRLYSESVNLLEFPIKTYYSNSYEGLTITDTYLKPCCEGVYSNLFITEGEFSDNDFAEAINIAPGYTKFIDFKVGEYDYQEALVRIVIEGSAQSQPTATGVVMHVDIPDTDDRGSAEITSTTGATKVKFNKPYYVIPEVQVTLKGANTTSGYVTPNIVDITTTYFTVELLTSSGTRATGSISWASKGY